jgi:thiol-disulfide isomerase/thioredoxin
LNLLLAAPVLAALIASAPVPSAVPPQDPVFQPVSYEQALELAHEGERLVVVWLVTEDCGDCDRMREKTWTNAAVQRWLEVEGVAVEIDAAARPDLVQAFAVESFPTLLFLERNGDEYHRASGYLKARQFVETFKGLHEGRLKLRMVKNALDEHPGDPVLRLDLARALVNLGLSQPGLDEYEAIWTSTRDAAEHDRLHFVKVPTEVAAMAGRFQPARRALLKWRARALRVLAGEEPGDPVVAARELSSIHQQMHDPQAQLAAWEEARAREGTPPAVLDALFDDEVIGQLYGLKRYDELSVGLGDTLVRADALLQGLEDFRRREREDLLLPEEGNTVIVLENLLVAKTSMYLEVLLRAGRTEEAEDLAGLVLAKEPSAHSYSSMMNAARRARENELARRIAEEGLALLKRKERDQLQAAYDRAFGGSKRQ